jgi:glyceraldehyde 3-phosphate dehydrogenase
LDGLAIRVPTPNVSLVDLVVKVEKTTTKEEVNAFLKEAAASNPYLKYSEEKLVSRDYNGNSASSIVDAASTYVINDLVKVMAWYDNEWGYSNRVVDLLKLIAK